MMIRGLILPYKTTMFVDFDCPLGKELLFSCIKAAEEKGNAIICAICSDMGKWHSHNLWLWQSAELRNVI